MKTVTVIINDGHKQIAEDSLQIHAHATALDIIEHYINEMLSDSVLPWQQLVFIYDGIILEVFER